MATKAKPQEPSESDRLRREFYRALIAGHFPDDPEGVARYLDLIIEEGLEEREARERVWGK
jgi:hypothetical protein